MDPATSLPEGTITFLLTDIEGSTRLWEQYPELMGPVIARHDALLTVAIEQHGGKVIRTRGEGDSFFAVFSQATDAVAAACGLQRALVAESWPEPIQLRLRAGINTGEAELRAGDYYGSSINRCARIRALAYGGQVLLGQTTDALVRDHLPEGVELRDLGAHRLKDLQRPERIYQLFHPDLPADFPPLRSLEAQPNNLPVQLTSFIGREQEMAEVKQLVAHHRLVTLTGTGGCGKTRLSLQVAADVLEEYPDGIWFVELAALTDPMLVPQAVATTLGVREEPGRSLLETLVDYLRPRSLLMLLDNCEHLVVACAQLAERLLRACPELRILATSREMLGILGETTWRVPSLSLPAPRQLPPAGPELVSTLTQCGAVRLFIERAAAALPTFTFTERMAPAVVQVCQRLDGIPLALELAAARVRVLSTEQIAARLDDRFRLLTGGSRTALPRQQTLRAAIDWSYNLLTEAERVLLRRLAVFAGGFTLEAAEAVCAGEAVEAYEILDLLGQLVDKSLVLIADPGTEEVSAAEIRYQLLETIRQYGWEMLRGTGEASMLQRRHSEWFLELAERAEAELKGPDQGVWLERLEREHDNLRAALAWCVESEEADGPLPVETGLRLGGALWRFWAVRGYLTEGRERLAWLLALPGAAERTAARAKALHGAAALAWHQGSYPAARALFEESLAIRRELGNRREIANSLINLGVVAEYQGDYAAARSLYEESLATKRESGDRLGIATALTNLGNVCHVLGEDDAARSHYEEALVIWRELGNKGAIAASLTNLGEVARCQGDDAAARALHEESLALQRELGDRQGTALSLNNLGDVARHQGDYEAARALFEESLAIERELGDQRGIAYSLTNLGCVAHGQGDDTTARALLLESLTLLKALEDRRAIAYSLEGLAAVATARGQPEQAARLFGAAAALRQALGAPLSPSERADLDAEMAAARARLGEAAFAAAWAKGQGMSLEEALAQASEGTGG